MPLRKRLLLEFSPAEKTPLPVILVVEKEEEVEELFCVIQPGWTEGVFRVMLDPRQTSLPNVITQAKWRPQVNMVSVCLTPQGHLYLEVGQLITLTFATWGSQTDGTVTLDAGTLIDFLIL